jgi:glycosyltransferase involved in cell wall biosynthesis
MEVKAKVTDLTALFNVDLSVLDQLAHHPIVVVIPAYNEERFIGSVIIKALQFPLTVIVVDDGSTDATAFVAEAAGARVIRHDHNLGKGVALNTGIAEARKIHPEVIVFIDGDGQHLVRDLPRLVAPILGRIADIVVGSRYLENTSTVPFHRIWGHRFFNFLTGLSSQVSVTDSQSGYRAFSSRAFNADLFLSTDFTVESEMQFFAHEQGLRVVEVPITVKYTDPPKRSVWSHGMSVLGGLIKLTGQYRPLLFFSLPGMVLLLMSFVMDLVIVERYSIYHQLAIGYAMVSVLLTIGGTISFATGIILHSIRGLLSDMLHRHSNQSVKFF